MRLESQADVFTLVSQKVFLDSSALGFRQAEWGGGIATYMGRVSF